MRIVSPHTIYIPQEEGIKGVHKQVELAGRTCYKSEDKITEDSAKEFVDRMIKSKHGAMLEHGTVYLMIPRNTLIYHRLDYASCYLSECYEDNKYSKIRYVENINTSGDYTCVTTNLRVLVENGWMDDLKYMCEPTEYHEKRFTFRFTTQVAITREANRHRVNSIGEESTRYCNYGKDKFGNEITICQPEFVDLEDCHFGKNYDLLSYCKHIALHEDITEGTDYFTPIDYWWFANLACEWSYINMIREGAKPQEARTILPLDLKSELVHTAFESDWKHFIELRTAQSAHPDIQVLANEVKKIIG